MNNAEQPINPDPMRGANQSHINQEPHNLNTGLTKREYFAGLAMQGLLANFNNANEMPPNRENVEYMVRLSALASDALLNELSKTK